MAESEYLAKPPSACCFVGNLHEGTPRGAVENILDIPTYISRPTEGKANGHIVLYFPDVWGLSNNASLLMDGFTDAGYLTLGIDYFCGVFLPISSVRIIPADGSVGPYLQLPRNP